MAAPKRKFLVAEQGFIGPDRLQVKAGQTVAADDPVVKGREHLFRPVEEVIEATTANPGELRITTHGRKAETDEPVED